MPSVGAVTSNLHVTTRSANYTASPNDFVVVDAIGAAVTITLPTAPVTNTLVAVKKNDASTNLVTVVPGAGATVGGDTSCLLAMRNAAVTLQYDGINWQVSSTAILNTSAPVAEQLLTPTYTPGLWYDRRTGFASGTSSGTITVPVSTINYTPAFLYRSVTIDRLAISTGGTTPTAGAVLRLGVYAPNSSNGPGTLITDFGTVSPTASNTVYQLTGTAVLPKGWVWFAVSTNNTAVNSLAGTNAAYGVIPIHGLPVANLQGVFLNSGAPMGVNHFTSVGDAAASSLASSAASATAVYPTTQTNANQPNFFYRVITVADLPTIGVAATGGGGSSSSPSPSYASSMRWEVN